MTQKIDKVCFFMLDYGKIKRKKRRKSMRMAAPSPTMAGELVAEDESDSVGATSGKFAGVEK